MIVRHIAESQTLAVKAANHVPLVFIDPMKFQRALFAQEKSGPLTRSPRSRRPRARRTKYVLEVSRSAAQASEVVRAAWSRYKGKDNPVSAPAGSRQSGSAHRSGFSDEAVLRPVAQQPVRHARQTRRRRTTGSCEYCFRCIEVLPGNGPHRPRQTMSSCTCTASFGRRVPENTSLGTDHGTAQVNFVMATRSRGDVRHAAKPLEPVLGDT